MSTAAIEQTAAGTHDLLRWRDPKRYLWLLGLLVPSLPFLGWALVEATGLALFWFTGPKNHIAPSPVSWTRPYAMNGSVGTISPSSHR